ncbi:MAG: Gfo/Idh/MocA family protein [Armatimonadota bacterium]
MPKKVKVAFVGSGGMAEAHSAPLSAMRDVQIVGYCDVVKSKAKRMAEQYDAAAFTDATEMMDAVEPDAVYFCLPPFAHGAELEAIKRGIPFLIEKPIGMDLALSKKIAAAVKRKRLLTSAAYMNRYRKGVQTVRKLLRDDPAIMMLGGWIGGTPRPRRGVGIWSWWVQKDKSGGQFLEQVTHTVDLARFLCGDAVQVHAYAAEGFNKGTPRNYSIEDASVVNIQFESGAVANLWASCSANAGGEGVSLNVYASKTTALFSGWEHSVRLLQAGKKERQIPGEDDIFGIENKAFIKAVRTGKADGIMSSYADAVNTLAISVAANKSMETGTPVKVG